MRTEPPEGLADVKPGPIAWMVEHRVAPNLLMIVLMLGGAYLAYRIKKEVFPEFSRDQVTISVIYPGASPEEIEQGIVLAIEEAVRGIEGIDEILATASEGSGRVQVQLLESADQQKAYQEIKQEIDRIRTFPEEAERAQVVLEMARREVLDVQIYGEASEWALREIAEQVRDRLLANPEITQVDLEGARRIEVHIEIPRDRLRAYGLTLGEVARRIRNIAVEIPGGSVKTRAGEILLRVTERRDWARQFAQIPIVTSAGGSVVRLGDLAVVRDGFENSDRAASYNGHRAIGLAVFRVGEQTPVGVSDAVREALVEIEPDLPSGVNYAINRDRSDIYRQRLELLLKNAALGLVLVLALLGIFLEIKLAIWVTMGIPISFLGAFLFLPSMGVTINMISMFAFIIALGIVVDDAIVAGENIYEHRQRGASFTAAAIVGTRQVAVPITFAILTNIVAFMPLLAVQGFVGKIFSVIPFVVTTVFLISWLEAIFVLPAHLAHTSSRSRSRIGEFVHARQQGFSRLFMRSVDRIYGPLLRVCLRARYLTVASALAMLGLVVAYVASGRIGIIQMPKVESDQAVATAVLPYGSPRAAVEAVQDRLVEDAMAIRAEKGEEKLVEGIYSQIEENKVEVTMYLTPPEVRPLGTAAVTALWRERVGPLVGLQMLRFESDRGGPGRGPGVSIELSHRNISVLDEASASLAAELEQFGPLKDIDDGYTPGKVQLSFRIKPAGRAMGLSSAEVARQVRHAFYGAEALRQQRGRNEIKVLVRLPEEQRVHEHDVEQLLMRTPSGQDIPLMQIAQVHRGNAYTAINRRNGRRTVTVTANVVPLDETSRILASLEKDVLPGLMRDHLGLSWRYGGRQEEMRKDMAGLMPAFLIALLIIYVLLAIPFRSYTQPLIVMTAIPFGIVGAVIGHWLMGYSLSTISMFGIVALSGVVVNDALVMIDFANRERSAGLSARTAIIAAGLRRFRPILLTTLTTFGGLAPMIFETSRQARFMIPMALSLGYGILFATAITLVLVPCLYLILEDAHGLHRVRIVEKRPAFE